MTVVGNPSIVEENSSGQVEVWNHSNVPTAEVMNQLPDNFRSLIASMGRWVQGTRRSNPPGRNGSLIDRDRYVTPDNVYAQMRLAYEAAENDDVVGGVLDSTEALAFSKVDFFAEDTDEQDIYNQWAGDVDLDARLREMWRELFTVSQVYCGVWWHTKTYKVRGKNRKKTMTLRCPKAITILDPLKIIPVGIPMFGQEELAWIATRSEAERIDRRGPEDEIFNRLILGPYDPTEDDVRRLSELGISTSEGKLYRMNPANVFRHTATKPGYDLFPAVRLKSIFELLDQKHQLRSMDRAHLIGGTNFIVLITQGSDTIPAKAEEIAHLQASVRLVAQTPVLVGDHRLDVKIVTPNLDQTLDAKRYDTIDTRISARCYQMFMRGAGGDKADSSEKLVKVVAQGMESRRKMLRRTLERYVLDVMYENNDELTTKPKLQYHPKEISLAFDSAQASFLLELRAAREISRFTILNQFGMSEDFEGQMLEREAEIFDPIFQSINPNNQGVGGVGAPGQPATKQAPPPNGPGPKAAPGAAPKSPAQIAVERRAGGRKGGAAPGTGQGQAPRRPNKTAAKKEKADE